MSEHCDEALARMYEFLDGEINQVDVAERIRFHLEDCPPCGDSFDFERRLKEVVRERLSEEVPADVMDRLRTVVRSEGLISD